MTKKQLLAVTRSVQDFIPRRKIPEDALFKKKAEKAELSFKKHVSGIVKKLAGEYKKILKMESDKSLSKEGKFSAADNDEQRKKLFLFHLNKTGAYFNMKEQLKAAVVHIVREVCAINLAISKEVAIYLKGGITTFHEPGICLFN